MTPWKRQAILIGVMLVMLAIAALWNVSWMMRQRANAQYASEDLAECKELTRVIESLRDKPTVASTQDMGIQELGQRIEAASRQAKFDGPALEGVFPQSARRVGDSPYLHKPTALALRNVTLMQLATFLYHLTDNSGLSVRDLRLRTPHGDAAYDVWDAEATLTYLIYSPPTKLGRD